MSSIKISAAFSGRLFKILIFFVAARLKSGRLFLTRQWCAIICISLIGVFALVVIIFLKSAISQLGCCNKCLDGLRRRSI